ncbi:MAG: hypothetical protein C0506_14120 [Anaerolinea sp.]|nr:hypothetical protein [Anaerolinea sp.]
MDGNDPPTIRLVQMQALGPFSWRWPEDVEHFDRGWSADAIVDGLEVRLRHGIGRREVYGRSRLHSVTWVEGQPTVEGVEADDFGASEALVSLIKAGKRHIRPGEPLPGGYGVFNVVVLAEAVAGPYSPRSLAVKLRLDDIEGWTRHALLRAKAWGRLGSSTRSRVQLAPLIAGGPAPATAATADAVGSRRVIAASLLELGASLSSTDHGPALDFTPNPEANELLQTDAFAFLIAVICDQGIVAERAWLVPFLLRARLGHLDPAQFAISEDDVRKAVQTPPMLHRYVEKVPRWLVQAAQLVVRRYGGDASRIWSGSPSADELRRRLDEFPGIGQKKAAMAVEILERDMGVPVSRLDRSDVAYDVHLRRVFLRTRLADRDEQDHMIQVARGLNPDRPGALDLPAWYVGRTWCHAGLPACSVCPLTNVCPKDIERAARVVSG